MKNGCLRGTRGFFGLQFAKDPKGEPIGEVVDVLDWRGKFVAKGFYNAHSSIPLRVLTRDQNDVVDANWMAKKIRQAIVLRLRAFDETVTNAYRLIHSENDFLPGLVVDRYADFLVIQIPYVGHGFVA